MSPTEYFVPIDLYTATYRVVGKARIRATGIWALIHDKTTDYLEIHEAHLASLVRPNTLLAKYQVISVAKVGIHAVAVQNPAHLGPGALPRAKAPTKRAYTVWGVTQVFEIQGTFYWSGRFSAPAILAEYKNAFIPLVEAQLRTAVLPTVRLAVPALLVNRNKVDLFAPIESRIPTKEPPRE